MLTNQSLPHCRSFNYYKICSFSFRYIFIVVNLIDLVVLAFMCDIVVYPISTIRVRIFHTLIKLMMMVMVMMMTTITTIINSHVFSKQEMAWNSKDFPRPFHRGAFEGFWWAFVTMSTVG